MFVRIVPILLIGLLFGACTTNSGTTTSNIPTATVAPAPTSAPTVPPLPTRAPATIVPSAPTVPPLPTHAPAAAATSAPVAAEPSPQVTLPLVTTPALPFPPKITLGQVGEGFTKPLFLTNAGDGSGRIFVVEKGGMIALLQNGMRSDTPFLDITERVGSSSSEQGLLSVVFHPLFAENGYLYVNYTDTNGDTVIARFTARDTADPDSEVILLQIDQPYANHNGGQIAFGPDGYLYIGMGDGGSSGDPQDNAQNPDSLLGKLLRINVDSGQPYAVPDDNPFAGGGGRPEIWASGLRNPWRFSFDTLTGDLYTGDVGQGSYEEVNMQPAGSPGGTNYGWDLTEGLHCYTSDCDLSAYTAPIIEYGHDLGCSVTGGYVYRGQAFPQLNGFYFYGDYCTGRIWALHQKSPGQWESSELMQSDAKISSFGQDEAGEMYLTDLDDGVILQIVAEG